MVRRVFSSEHKAWKQLCRVFEPWGSSRFQWMLQASLPSTRTDSSVRENQRLSGDRTSENVELAVLQRHLSNGEPARQRGRQSGSPTMTCDLACGEIAEHIRAASGAAGARTCRHVAMAKAAEEPGRKQRCQDGEAEGMLLLCDVQS